MACTWTFLSEPQRSGVACHNFAANGCTNGLELIVGDMVHVLRESVDWYFGSKVSETGQRSQGVFPKSFVRISNNFAVERLSNGYEKIMPKRDLLLQELSLSIREWWRICKTLFVEAVKDVKLKISRKIDVVNSLLSLDMVIRDDKGIPVNPDGVSTMQLFRQHEQVLQRIRDETRASANLDTDPRRPSVGSYGLFAAIHAMAVRSQIEAEVSFALFDAQMNQYVTEFFSFTWTCKQASRYSVLMGSPHAGFVKSSQNGPSVHQNGGPMSEPCVVFSDLISKDLEREKLLLVCRVLRHGPLESDGSLPRKQSHSLVVVKQPVAVGAVDITDIFRTFGTDRDKEWQLCFVLHLCPEECTENHLRRLITNRTFARLDQSSSGMNVFRSDSPAAGSSPRVDLKDPSGVQLTLRLLPGTYREIKQFFPHLFVSHVHNAQRLGFPDVISPGDNRNDFYLTLGRGEFDKKKSIECRACLVKANPVDVTDRFNAAILESIVCNSDDVNRRKQFFSTCVYYHNDKPDWNEMLKISVPFDDFNNAHIRMIFRHRSPIEAKDKNEKPFALSFVRLIQESGTVLQDGSHELLVYRINKTFDESDVSYLNLPGTKAELEKAFPGSAGLANMRLNVQQDGFVLSLKETFCISTRILSTKLTQNVELLGLLKSESRVNLKKNLCALMGADGERSGEEVVKFLEDILDALFAILITTSEYDHLVFDCLVYVISLVGERRYHNFRPVMDAYLSRNFSSALAYSKLILILKQYLDNALKYDKQLNNALKAIEYLAKFIVRSWHLHVQLKGHDGYPRLLEQLSGLLSSICNLMTEKETQLTISQGLALKHLPSAIPSFIALMEPRRFTSILLNILEHVPANFTKQKITCIREVSRSELFKNSECRSLLLPIALTNAKYLLNNDLEIETAFNLLTEILDILHQSNNKGKYDDKDHLLILTAILRPVVQTVIGLIDIGAKAKDLTLKFNAVLLAVLSKVCLDHYNAYIHQFQLPQDITDFMLELLMLIRDIVIKSPFPSDWQQMILIQNSVFLKTLRFFSQSILENFGMRSAAMKFETQLVQVRKHFFMTCVAFMNQPHLQLEQFDEAKRSQILARYNDMRLECAMFVRSMWFSLSSPKDKLAFLPDMVGTFLEMTLIPVPELREATICVFFDMLVAQFYGTRKLAADRRSVSFSLAAVHSLEKELITNLDTLVENGRGDLDYVNLFTKQMTDLCAAHCHSDVRESGLRLISTVDNLLHKLLEYKEARERFENVESRMSCIVSILEFYRQIKHTDLYVKYLEKLYQGNMACENFVEAAFVLKLYCDGLSWKDDPLLSTAHTRLAPNAKTERELKEELYFTIIDLFSRGQLWENSLLICKELEELFADFHEYEKLSALMENMARFYRSIMTVTRPEPEYFRVGCFGLGFPLFLRNKVFIYRGLPLERLEAFQLRMLNLFPQAKIFNSLNAPDDSLKLSDVQLLQMNKVDPVFDVLSMKCIRSPCKSILWYYKYNDIAKFSFNRPIAKAVVDKDDSNMFASMWIERTTLVCAESLPNILRWIPVSYVDVVEYSPLENAIQSMQQTFVGLRDLIDDTIANAAQSLKRLQPKLKGILDPSVMGGFVNYEKAFFNAKFAESATPEDLVNVEKLKQEIANLVPLLELGLFHHARRLGLEAPTSIELQLHEMMLECFCEMKAKVEARYGCRSSLLPPNASLSVSQNVLTTPSAQQMRKQNSVDSLVTTASSAGAACEYDGNTSSTSRQSSSTGYLHRTPFRNPLMYAAASFTLRRSNEKDNSNSSKDWQMVSIRSSNLSLASQMSDCSSAGIIELTQNLQAKRPRRRQELPARLRRRSASINSLSVGEMDESNHNDNNLEDSSPPPLPSRGSLCNGASIEISLSHCETPPPPLPARRSNTPSGNSVSLTPSPPIFSREQTSVTPPTIPPKPNFRKEKPLPALPSKSPPPLEDMP